MLISKEGLVRATDRPHCHAHCAPRPPRPASCCLARRRRCHCVCQLSSECREHRDTQLGDPFCAKVGRQHGLPAVSERAGGGNQRRGPADVEAGIQLRTAVRTARRGRVCTEPHTSAIPTHANCKRAQTLPDLAPPSAAAATMVARYRLPMRAASPIPPIRGTTSPNPARVCLSGWLSGCLAVWLSFWLAGWLAVWPPACPPVRVAEAAAVTGQDSCSRCMPFVRICHIDIDM